MFLMSALVLFCFTFGFAVQAAEDPYYAQQWYLNKIKAPEAWQKSKGSSSVIVAVLDTGVAIDHPDLTGNIWINADETPADGVDNDHNGYIDDVNGWDFVTNKADPRPKITGNFSSTAVNHGTFVAGIISAVHDNGQGTKGVTANVRIMPLLVLDASGWGGSDSVSKAIDYAVANGAQIINLSFGGYEHSLKLKNSIINAYNSGILIVAAAGNALDGELVGKDATTNPIYPICYDKELGKNMILGVIASTSQDRVAEFSNYGAGCIDIAAPGTNIAGLLYQNSKYTAFQKYYDTGWNGTSFSAAMVSGAAALLKSVDMSLSPDKMIQTLMEESGMLFVSDQKWTNKVGSGILNIQNAITKLFGTILTTITNVVTPSPSAPVVAGSDILVATKSGGNGVIRVFDSTFKKKKDIEAFAGVGTKGMNLYVADVNGGLSDIVVGEVKGVKQPFVRVVDDSGAILSSFAPFDANFAGGVEVAAGNVDNAAAVEIVVAPESGMKPIVKIFDLAGNLKRQFLAYNETFTGGINLAVGDVDKDGKNEIITAPHKGLMPKIKIFDGTGKVKKDILAYGATFMGGVNISLADVDNNGQLDIITGAGPGGSAHVQAFAYSGAKLVSFVAYSAGFSGGVEVKGIDWNKDGKTEIITAAGPGGGPHVKIFNKSGNLVKEFFAFENSFTFGINIEAK